MHKNNKICVISNFTINIFAEKYDDNIVCIDNLFLIDDEKESIDKCETVLIWVSILQLIGISETDTKKLSLASSVMKNILLKIKNVTDMISKDIYISVNYDFYLTKRKVDKFDFSIDLKNIVNNTLPNAKIIDFEKLIDYKGVNNVYDMKNYYRWHCPYSQDYIQQCLDYIYLKKINNSSKIKCVVLDCDNVLWGGIIDEISIENIACGNEGEGRIYKDFQYILKELSKQGVLLTICSKNDIKDVYSALASDNMILSWEDFACIECSWDNKVDSIVKISNTLNIGYESMLFIDDMSIEIESVKKCIPQINILQFKKYYALKEILNYDFFLSNTDDALLRLRTYKDNEKRDKLRRNSIDYKDFLEQLNTEVEIHIMRENEIRRVSELSFRTNKCTIGQRYTVEDLYKNKMWKVYVIYLRDVYGDLGLVGAIGIDEMDEIRLFCLSCRALGRGVEDDMIEYIKQNLNVKKVHCSQGEKNSEIIGKLKKLELNV